MDVKDERLFRITPVQQMAAACSGALLTSLMVTPLDVVKIRLQAQQKTMSNKCFLYCNGLMDHLCPCFSDTGTGISSNPQSHLSPNWYERPGKFSGTFDAFIKITRNEGISSLWSGLSPTLVLAIPSTVVYFVTYEQLRVRLNDRYASKLNFCHLDTQYQPYWVPLVAGATARMWAATIVSPLELIRTKMQSKRLSYFEIGQALKSLLQYHGIAGLWKGLGSTLLRDVPFSAIYWVLYEWFKATAAPPKQFNTGYSLVGGAFAGGVAALVTTPFDVAKTHQQIELGEKEIYRGQTKRPNIPETQDARVFLNRLYQYLSEPPGKSKMTTYSVLRRVYTQNGLPGLFAGLTPRLVKVAPACAIMVSSFEYGKSFFERYNRSRYMEAQLRKRL